MQQSKKYAFINSQDQRYFDTIGKYMLKSFLTYAPAHFDLYFYNEGINDLEGIEKYKNFHNINWNETCGADWQKFANNCSDSSAQKFGKKGWASIHGWRNIKADYLVWLDADLLFYKNFNEDIINTTINENKLIGLFMPAVFDLSTLRFKNKTQTPMNHSPLAEYFGHQKGKSKKHLDEKYFKEKTGL